MIEPLLSLVHFQITRNCNLRCFFCGQWGEHGFMHEKGAAKPDLPLEEWKKAVDSLARYGEKHGRFPQVTIWGGEPLLYKGIDDILRYMKERGIKSSMVTNGVLLADHLDVVNECLSTLYVSVDGPKELHEKTRRVEGIYDTIMANVARVDTSRLNTVCMCTVNELNYDIIPDFPYELEGKNFGNVLFQNLIFMTPEDTQRYRDWIKESFDLDAPHADAWTVDSFAEYIHKLPDTMRLMEERIAQNAYPMKVTLFPPEVNSKTITDYYFNPDGVPASKTEDNYCWAPFKHVNVDANGGVLPCIDFDDMVFGNITNGDLIDIFEGEMFDKFRAEIANGNNPACKHCPWKYNTCFALD